MLSREGQQKLLIPKTQTQIRVSCSPACRYTAACCWQHGLRKVGQQTGALTQILRRGTCDGIQAQLSVNVCWCSMHTCCPLYQIPTPPPWLNIVLFPLRENPERTFDVVLQVACPTSENEGRSCYYNYDLHCVWVFVFFEWRAEIHNKKKPLSTLFACYFLKVISGSFKPHMPRIETVLRLQ